MKLASVGLIAVLVTFTATLSFAQTGSIQGQVRDDKTGDPLIGANVLIVGTTLGSSTDLDGRYTIEGIPPGTYDVRIFYVGFVDQIKPGINVQTGKPTKLNVKLEPLGDLGPGTFTVDDLLVSAERVLSTDAALFTERINSATIGDAVSAEQISKSPDGTSSEVLKRVTGLSVVDDKFVFVRGVTDRYNATALNGVTVTSTDTDADKKSFAFDMIPASLLSNTVVVKTASPDLEGNFTGGFVQVNTLDFPSERVMRVTLGSSYNSQASTQTMQMNALSPGGTKDWLGFDDGIRALPDGFETMDGFELGQSLPNTWALRSQKAPLNGSFSLSYGDRYRILGKDLGVVAAYVYKNSYNNQQFKIRPFLSDQLHVGRRWTYNVLWGLIFNTGFKLSEGNKIAFNGNYIQSGKEQNSDSEGPNHQTEQIRRYAREWDERGLLVTQLKGDHRLPVLDDSKAKWSVFYSNTHAEEPDRRIADFGPSTFPRGLWLLKDNSRQWFDLREYSGGMTFDLTFGKAQTKIKTGARYDERQRDFEMNAWSTLIDGRDGQSLKKLPIEEIFEPDHYNPGSFTQGIRSPNLGDYTGEMSIYAIYQMIDTPLLTKKLRGSGGWRVERSDQLIDTSDPDNPQGIRVTSRKFNNDVLPSINLTYYANDFVNIRASASQSLNRPEFRELAKTRYFDMDKFRNVIGNPNLVRSKITNYDFRFEFYPDFNELVAFSYFYKKFKDPIEEKLIRNPERNVQTWFNSPSAVNEGYELEVRKSLGFLGDIFRTYMVIANYTRVESSVDWFDDTINVQEWKTRSMQGQYPWSFNMSFQYDDPRYDASISFLYHRAGRRLAEVGDVREEDVYEEVSDQFDFACSKFLFDRRYRIKFAIKNISGNDDIFTDGKGELFRRVSRGTHYSLQFSYHL